MTHNLSKKEQFKLWIYLNDRKIIGFVIFAILCGIYIAYHISKSNQGKIDFTKYTETTKTISISFEKTNKLPEIYATEVKIDKILFDLNYFYNHKEYNSKINVAAKHIQAIIPILKKRNFNKLEIKCNKDNPRDAMVFIKKFNNYNE